jgi:alkylhydroperoxidase family enzyme
MAFFDLPADAEMPPASLRALEEWRREVGAQEISPTMRTWGRMPRILEARLATLVKLHRDCAFPPEAKHTAAMLIAHARRCSSCFASSRSQLTSLGFDEAALDAMCANPDALPLDPRGRRFVHWTLRIAADPAGLTPDDFRAMAADGFSAEEVQDIIGFTVFWVSNTMFTTASRVALTEG